MLLATQPKIDPDKNGELLTKFKKVSAVSASEDGKFFAYVGESDEESKIMIYDVDDAIKSKVECSIIDASSWPRKPIELKIFMDPFSKEWHIIALSSEMVVRIFKMFTGQQIYFARLPYYDDIFKEFL